VNCHIHDVRHRWAAWRSSCEFRFATPLPRSQVALAFSSPILRPTAISLAAAADGTLQRAFADRSNDDGGDEGSGGSKIGIAFGQGADGGPGVVAEVIGEQGQAPAWNISAATSHAAVAHALCICAPQSNKPARIGQYYSSVYCSTLFTPCVPQQAVPFTLCV